MSVTAEFQVFCYLRVLALFRRALPALLCLLLWRQAGAATPILTQRGINEMAAALESARLALIEDTGLRRPQEPLAAYLERLAQPQPGEAPAAYDARMVGYLQALRRAVSATAAASHGLVLRHTDAAHQRCWERAAQALKLLPPRMDRLERAWRQAQHEHRAIPAPGLGGQLAQTLGLVLAAYNALRDARP